MLNLVIKATLLLAIGWIAAVVLRRRAASTRHAIWVGLLAATLLLPAIAMLAPSIDIPLLPGDTSNQRATRITTTRTAPNEVTAVAYAGSKEIGTSRIRLNQSSETPQDPVAGPSWPTPWNIVLAVWALVGLALVLRIAAAHLQARGLLRTCGAAPARLTNTLDGVAASLGIKATELRLAPPGMMPAVVGVYRPFIVLPADAAAWSEERLELVLRHECAHVRRRDAMLQLVAGLATSVYWWHPLAWVAARHVIRDRELACDDMVIASGTPAQRYADHLLDIARSLKSSRQPALAALAMARPSQLEGRVIALLEERPRGASPARALATGMMLSLFAVSLIAPMKLVARAEAALTPDPAQQIDSTQSVGSAAAPQQQPAPSTPIPTRPQSDDELYAALLKALKDIDADVRAVAVSALAANTVDYARLAALISPLINDASADVRAAVVGALLKMESPQASSVLLKALEDDDPDVRQLALTGLVRLESNDVIPHLAEALKDASEDVRTIAVLGIDGLNHPQRKTLLLQAATDMSEEVRTLVAYALADETGADVTPVITKLAQDVSADVRHAAVIVMASTRGADVSAFLTSLRDADADVRAAAAIGLGSIADKAATPALTEALKDVHADVRSAAAIALGAIGDPAALRVLTVAVADVDADVRKSALTAAASIGGDWQAGTTVTTTIAGTIAGTITGTLQGTLWGGAQGYSGRSYDDKDAGPQRPRQAGMVEIAGAIKRPGFFPWSEGLTVARLVQLAGGLADGATLGGVIIERRANGRIIKITGDEKMVVREHDTVTIRRL